MANALHETTTMTAMTAFEERNHIRAGGTERHGRCQTTLERLPKALLQHLHASWLGSPEGKDKTDLVSSLWQRFAVGDMAALFWRDVRQEWDRIERIKAQSAPRRPKP